MNNIMVTPAQPGWRVLNFVPEMDNQPIHPNELLSVPIVAWGVKHIERSNGNSEFTVYPLKPGTNFSVLSENVLLAPDGQVIVADVDFHANLSEWISYENEQRRKRRGLKK